MAKHKTVAELVAEAPQETRERWYVQMNCWGCPADFPVPLPDFTGREHDQFDDHEWRAAFSAVSNSLTTEQMSRAWWLLELGKTEEEWRAWWNNRRRAKATANG